ncbi:hypothetical protein [Metabacillus idriensis]|uniref:hypothetical protein n=1 Tax=Metabacillus idriensis TaxID=324768 RepID=UPI00174D328D|nr:hypothetical protein [Metabacillus idriensis]
MRKQVIDLEEALSDLEDSLNTAQNFVEEVASGLEALVDSMGDFVDEDDPEAVKIAIKEFISDAEAILRNIK